MTEESVKPQIEPSNGHDKSDIEALRDKEYLSPAEAQSLYPQRTARTYRNLAGSEIEAIKNDAGDWLLKHDSLKEHFERKGYKTEKAEPIPAIVSEKVKQSQEDLLIAQNKAKLSAFLAGYPPDDPVGAWKKDVAKTKEMLAERKSELDKDETLVKTRMAELVHNETLQAAREKDLKEKQERLDAQEKALAKQARDIEQIEASEREKAEQKTSEFLTKALRMYAKGMDTPLTEIAWWSTMPLVKAAGYVQFKGCEDCHKEDAKLRVSEFEIPKPVVLDTCPDCDQPEMWVDGEKKPRVLPKYLCELCPLEFVLQRTKEFAIAALEAQGLPIHFDEAGQYIKPIDPTKLTAREIIANIINRLKTEDASEIK